MDERERIRLGHNQRFIAIEEVGDFARRNSIVIILTENAHFTVVQNTKRFFDRNQLTIVALALEGELTHTEEDETIIAQPFEERDGFRHCGIPVNS